MKKSLAGHVFCIHKGRLVRKLFPLSLICSGALVLSATAVHAEGLARSKSQFVFKDQKGQTVSAPIVDQFRKDRIVHPFAKIDRRLDPKLSRAATIADERANARSRSACWRYVKQALLASGAVTSYPKTAMAKQAGDELVRSYGFKKLPVRDPYQAPLGAVLVYGARRAAGHVEIRTKNGFTSDFRAKTPSRRPLIGVFGKVG
jgi:hypothetical protein